LSPGRNYSLGTGVSFKTPWKYSGFHRKFQPILSFSRVRLFCIRPFFMNIENPMILRKAAEPAITFLFALGFAAIGYIGIQASVQEPTDQQAGHAIAIAKAARLPDGQTSKFRRMPHEDVYLFGVIPFTPSEDVLVSRQGNCYRVQGVMIPGTHISGIGRQKCYPKNG
jgi:hypothetical protein